MIRDRQEGIEQIVWQVDGKVKAIYFTQASNKNNLEFDYDAFGRRVAKHEYDQNDFFKKSTYYLLDVSGNLMNTYIHKPDAPAPFELTERVIYGSSRLGMNTKKADMLFPVSENVLSSYTGEKLYEMTNHLGNVLTVINDIKVPYQSGADILYYATIVSTSDYSPFGVTLDMDGGRTQYLNISENDYRYKGYQGSEKDDEVKGVGNHYTTTFRAYDPRLGRWFSLDPEASSFPFESNYVSNHNNPIIYVDPKGDYPILVGAAIGAVTDFMMQFTKNLFKPNDDGKRWDVKNALKLIDWADVAVSAAMGAILPATGMFNYGSSNSFSISQGDYKMTKAIVKGVGKIVQGGVDLTYDYGKINNEGEKQKGVGWRLHVAGVKYKGNVKFGGKKTNYILSDLVNIGIGAAIQAYDFLPSVNDYGHGFFQQFQYGETWGVEFPNVDGYESWYFGNQVTSNAAQQLAEGLPKGIAFLGYENAYWYTKKYPRDKYKPDPLPALPKYPDPPPPGRTWQIPEVPPH